MRNYCCSTLTLAHSVKALLFLCLQLYSASTIDVKSSSHPKHPFSQTFTVRSYLFSSAAGHLAPDDLHQDLGAKGCKTWSWAKLKTWTFNWLELKSFLLHFVLRNGTYQFLTTRCRLLKKFRKSPKYRQMPYCKKTSRLKMLFSAWLREISPL